MCFKKKEKKDPNQFRDLYLNEYNPNSTTSKSPRNERLGTRDDEEEYQKYPKNVTKTSQYTLLSFFPVFLFMYFTKYTNFYFLVMTSILTIESISPFSLTSAVAPLLFIIILSMLREAYEDYFRYKSDKESNNSKTLIIVQGQLKEVFWRELKTGDLVVVRKNTRIPADLLLMGTSKDDGSSFMETSTLDGEKHLKPRNCLKETLSLVKMDLTVEVKTESKKKDKKQKHEKTEYSAKIDIDLDIKVSVKEPNPSLYNFEGFLKFSSQPSLKPISFGVKNYLFKGAMIRNIDWVIGMAVYTGTDTKIQQNGADARFKISKIESKMHKMIIILFIIQTIFALFALCAKVLFDWIRDSNYEDYLDEITGETDNGNLFLIFVRYFVLMSSIIPISLIVNIEMVRMVQAYYITQSLDLKNKELNRPCKVSTTTINEELGQIEYVLTDKTGTLTQNKMVLRGICIGDKLYGGEFVINKNGDSEFRKFHSDRIDIELEELLAGKNTGNLPYPIDIWNSQLKISNEQKRERLRPVTNNQKLNFMKNSHININLSRTPSKKLKPVFFGQEGTDDDKKPTNEEGLNAQEFDEFFVPEKRPILNPRIEKMKKEPRLALVGARKSLGRLNTLENYREEFRKKPLTERNCPPNLSNGTTFKHYEELAKEFILCAALNHELLIEKEDGKEKYQGSSPDEIAICKAAKEIGCEFKGNSLGVSTLDYFGKQLKFEVKMFFEFDSKRKRSSLVIFDGQNYRLLVKGADSAIIPNLTKEWHHPYLEDTEDYLTKFSLLGYRTLVFAEKYFTEKEFQDLQVRYDKAMNGGNRKKDVKLLAEEIEIDLVLLGCTAVEDSLQLNVKEAITKLLQAQIKVWMITGDKLETAENIGIMAGIVDREMKVFYIKDVNKENFIEVANNLDKEVQEVEEGVKIAIVFDMRSVDFIFSNYDENIKEADTLANLLMKADSVVCARSTPKQKAKIVSFVRQRKKICLAIGDGANDVNMIRVINPI